MFLYSILTIPVAILAGILIARLSKGTGNDKPVKLDRIGRITNIALIPIYAYFAPLTVILGSISIPSREGALGVIGWIISAFIASGPLYSGVGLGLSVALRKKGRSTASFVVQFAGAAGYILSVILYAVTVGNLITPLN